jgi:Trp operon repressor
MAGLRVRFSSEVLENNESQAEMLRSQAASGEIITVRGNRLREVDTEEEFADDDEATLLGFFAGPPARAA